MFILSLNLIDSFLADNPKSSLFLAEKMIDLDALIKNPVLAKSFAESTEVFKSPPCLPIPGIRKDLDGYYSLKLFISLGYVAPIT